MTYEELRQEFTRPSFRKKLRDKLGEVCINCETTKNIEYHHVVPLKNGGTNKLSNIVPICEECHCKAHNKIYKNTKNNGRPKAITFEEAEPILYRYFNLEIGKSVTRELLGIKGNSTWEKLTKEYKIKYNISKGFRNNIDLLRSQAKRIESMKNNSK